MNIRTSIIILLFSLVARAGITQPWHFNNIYNPNNTWSAGMSIIGINNGYFGCTVSCDSVSDFFYNTSTFILNPTGEMTTWKNYGRIGADYFPGDEGALVMENNNFGLFGSIQDWDKDSILGIFFKFDQSGDTVFTRNFASDTFNVLVGRSCTATIDTGFALVGDVSKDFNYSDIVLIKIDSNGNEQWRNYFGTEIDDWTKSIIQTPDKGYAIGSWSRIPGIEETADPIIFKTDSLGNFEWSINLGGPFMDDKAMLCMTLDSCIMVLTAYADSMYTPEYGYSRINLVKLDLQGNTLWNRKFGASRAKNFISNIILLDNGDYMACGYVKISGYLNPGGWLFRFNPDGDSIWYREYYYYPEAPNFAMNYLFDLSQTEDQGFVATGQAFHLLPPEGTQNLWVLKVDSVGCEIENCWVGIEEPGGGEAWERGSGEAVEQGSLELWPNPARDIVDCRWSYFDGRGEVTLVIYDIFGRTILSLPRLGEGQGGGWRSWQVDVSSLPAGIYLAVVRDEKGFLGSAKFIVAR